MSTARNKFLDSSLAIYRVYMCAYNDFEIPLHYRQRSTSSTYHWPTRRGRERVRETPDYGPGGNRRHVARGKRVFTGDKFKASVSATRTRLGTTGCTANNTCRDSQCGCREEGIGRPDKSNVCTLVRCTMETPRERGHLSLQADRASFGPAVCNRRGDAAAPLIIRVISLVRENAT